MGYILGGFGSNSPNATQYKVMSIIGCLALIIGIIMILIILFHKRFHTPTFKFVAILTFMEVIADTNFTFQNGATGSSACRFSGWLIQFAYLSSAFWSLMISFHIKRSIESLGYKCNRKQWIKYTLVSIGVPFIVAWIPLILSWNDGYVALDDHCWIGQKYEILRFLLLFGPIWIIIAFNIYTYWHLKKMMSNVLDSIAITPAKQSTFSQMYAGFTRKGSTKNIEIIDSKNQNNIEKEKAITVPHLNSLSKDEARKMHSTFAALNLYPLIQAFAWLPSTIQRVWNIFTPYTDIWDWLHYTCIISVISTPILNAVVFFSYPSVRSLVSEKLWRANISSKSDGYIKREETFLSNSQNSNHSRESIYAEDLENDSLGVIEDEEGGKFTEFYGSDTERFDHVLDNHREGKSIHHRNPEIEMHNPISTPNPISDATDL